MEIEPRREREIYAINPISEKGEAFGLGEKINSRFARKIARGQGLESALFQANASYWKTKMKKDGTHDVPLPYQSDWEILLGKKTRVREKDPVAYARRIVWVFNWNICCIKIGAFLARESMLFEILRYLIVFKWS